MSVAAIVLAAGQGSRFGDGPKQLAPIAGTPMVARVVTLALAAPVDAVVVVVGHEADAVSAAVPVDDRVRVVRNPAHRSGMSSSIRAGVLALEPGVGIATVLLGDQPGVSVATIAAVVAAVERGARAARIAYTDGPGHPVAVARSLFRDLLAVRGDRGAREIVDRASPEAISWPTAAPRDVDHPDDLMRL